MTHSVVAGALDWPNKPGGVEILAEMRAQRVQVQPELKRAMQRVMRDFYKASHVFVALAGSAADSILESWTRPAAGDVSPREGVVPSF